jgi:hypothetical protein
MLITFLTCQESRRREAEEKVDSISNNVIALRKKLNLTLRSLLILESSNEWQQTSH